MQKPIHKNLKREFSDLYEQFSDAIFRYCYLQVKSRGKAMDITQDTFIKTWEYLASGRKVENLKAFLYKVAKNLIIDDFRKKKPISLEKIQEKGFDAKDDENEEEKKEDIFESKLVLEIVEKLKPKYRDVIIFRFVEDMSVKSIAEMIGETENNISVRIHRALEQIKEILEEN